MSKPTRGQGVVADGAVHVPSDDVGAEDVSVYLGTGLRKGKGGGIKIFLTGCDR